MHPFNESSKQYSNQYAFRPDQWHGVGGNLDGITTFTNIGIDIGQLLLNALNKQVRHGLSGFIIRIFCCNATLEREYVEAQLNLNQILCRLAEARKDLTENLKQLQCRTLIFVGENSQFHAEVVHMTAKLDRRYSALVEVQACGSVVTEKQPHAMLIPMEYFLMGYGLYRPRQINYSPRSPLNPFCISPELLSPESMGVKLKPIKTRANLKA
ncbi:hypothetical protein ZEAMMB73_Zm00001d048596 [Zea mays]|uniref:Pollen-specific protein SF21 n=1 Tax=Zea mays TaxID=4577 RepID=A0A1D6PMZ6_MAIZE|nr:hypothetical protein ZEAMMB73_Zm00001d048596 [Zea mays]